MAPPSPGAVRKREKKREKSLTHWRNAVEFLANVSTEADVACTSINLRRAIYGRLCEELAAMVKANGGTRFPAFALASRIWAAMHWTTTVHLHSPRLSDRQSDFGAGSRFLAVYDNGLGSDAGMMRFTRLPLWCFNELLQAFTAPAEEGQDGRGRPRRLTDAERLGMALRFMSTSGTLDQLGADFSTAHTVRDRWLKPSLQQLKAVLLENSAAQLRYPSLEEAELLEAAARHQHGEPPEGFDFETPCVLAADGCIFIMQGSADIVQQALHAHRSGLMACNCFFVVDLRGRFVDVELCGLGVSHDTVLGQRAMAAHADPVANPDRLGMVVDSGLMAYRNSGANGRAAVFSPMKNGESVPAGCMADAKAWSNYVVRRRQMIERLNGQLKRSWARTLVPVSIADKDDFRLVLEVAVLLNNYRTNKIGFNAINTTYWRIIDADFRDQLVAAREAGSSGLSRYIEGMRAIDDAGKRRRNLADVETE